MPKKILLLIYFLVLVRNLKLNHLIDRTIIFCDVVHMINKNLNSSTEHKKHIVNALNLANDF